MAMWISKFNRLISSKIVWIIFAFVVAFSMVFFIPGADPFAGGGKDGGRAGDVGGREVSNNELEASRRAVRLFGGQNSDAGAWNRIVQLGEADRAGVQVSDIEVLRGMRNFVDRNSNPQDGDAQTRFENLQRNIAEQIGIGPKELGKAMRDNLRIQSLQGRVVDTVLVPEFDVRRFFDRLNDQYAIDYVSVTNPIDAAGVEITEEQIQEYYDENTNSFEFLQEELREGRIASFDYLGFVDIDAISSNEVEEYYRFNYEEFLKQVTIPNPAYELDTNYNKEVTTWEVTPLAEVEAGIRTNLALSGDASTLAGDEARRLIEALAGTNSLVDIAGGFTNLVVTNTGWVSRTNELPGVDADAVVQVRSTLFLLETNEVSRVSETPVVGRNKAYVVVLDGRREARVKTFEEGRSIAEAGARRIKVRELFEEHVDTVSSNLQATVTASNTFSNAVATADLGRVFRQVIVPSDQFGTNGIPMLQQLVSAAMDKNPGEFIEPQITGEDPFLRGMVGVLAERNPSPQYASKLEEERPGLTSSLESFFQEAVLPQWSIDLQKSSGVPSLMTAAAEFEESMRERYRDPPEEAEKTNDINTATNTLSDATNTVEQVISTGSNAVEKATGVVEDVTSNAVEKVVEPVKEAASNEVEKVVEPVKEAASNEVEEVVEPVKEAATSDAVEKAKEVVGESASNAVEQTVDAVKATASNAVEKVIGTPVPAPSPPKP